MNALDSTVPDAVAVASSAIAAAIDAIAERMRGGGRLVYVGAGSSGTIAALDASECEATFSTRPGVVRALVAGGETAAALEQAAAEDDRGAGAADIRALEISAVDSVVGVSASGRTPYVLGALEAAAETGALTACVVSAPDSRARRTRRPRDRRRRRPGVPRRIDATQGRNGAEARAQHDLDHLDDPARKDLRESHGRRRRGEREAPRPRSAHRGSRDRAHPPSRSTPPSLQRTATHASRSSRSSPASTPTTARARLDESGRSIAEALEQTT